MNELRKMMDEEMIRELDQLPLIQDENEQKLAMERFDMLGRQRAAMSQELGKRVEIVTRTAVEIAGIALPIMFYAKWMKEGFQFEETNTFKSTTFRNLFGKFRPFK